MKKSLQNMVAKGMIVAGLAIPGLTFTGAVTSTLIDNIKGVTRPSAQVSKYYDLKSKLDKEPVNEFDQRIYPILKEEFQALQSDSSIVRDIEVYESKRARNLGLGFASLVSLFLGLYLTHRGARKLYNLKDKTP